MKIIRTYFRRQEKSLPTGNAPRQGSIGVLTAILLPVLLVFAGITINLAYIQLVRTQQMVASDAAVRAGGRALSYYQDVDSAKQAAQNTAALNLVAGDPLQLSSLDADNEIEFGASTLLASGRYAFTKLDTSLIRVGTLTPNAVRVTSDSGPIPTLISMLGGGSTVRLACSVVTTQVDRDIMLVLDRSGSMDDIQNNDYENWDWQGQTPRQDTDALSAGVAAGVLFYNGKYWPIKPEDGWGAYHIWAWQHYYNFGDAPVPWGFLKQGVDQFLDVLADTPTVEHVGLTSYSEEGTLHVTVVDDYDLVRSELDSLSPYGRTAIGDGIQVGSDPLRLDGRPFANKTMVIMTDGYHNLGISPEDAATAAVNAFDVTIHTVTYGNYANQADMQLVAAIGGGRHYHATDAITLTNIFEEIANNLPTIVTE